MLTIRAYFPTALPVYPPPPPPPVSPPPPAPAAMAIYENVSQFPQGHLGDVPAYHPSYYGFPFPLPPRIEQPEAKRNCIYWPLWGLHRYATGSVLVSSEEFKSLRDTPGYVGAVRVAFDDDASGTGTLLMRVIGASPVSDYRTPPLSGVPAASDEAIAWMLTLVDERYIWNERVYVDTGSSAPASWGALISDLIAQASGQTVTAATINALIAGAPAYPTPGTIWSKNNLKGLSACCLVDAACLAVNLRCAVAEDGTITVQNATTAATALSALGTTHSPELFYGGVEWLGLDTPEAVRYLSYDTTGLTAVNRVTVTGGTHGDLVVAIPYDDANGRTRYTTDYGTWTNLDVFEATFSGFVPLPVCSALGVWVLDHDAAVSRIVSDPERYPWPTVIPSWATTVGGGGGALETVNSDTTQDEPATTKVTASLTSGVRFDKGAVGQTTLSAVPASVTQQGVVTAPGSSTFLGLPSQSFSGNKGLPGYLFFSGQTTLETTSSPRRTAHAAFYQPTVSGGSVVGYTHPGGSMETRGILGTSIAVGVYGFPSITGIVTGTVLLDGGQFSHCVTNNTIGGWHIAPLEPNLPLAFQDTTFGLPSTQQNIIVGSTFTSKTGYAVGVQYANPFGQVSTKLMAPATAVIRETVAGGQRDHYFSGGIYGGYLQTIVPPPPPPPAVPPPPPPVVPPPPPPAVTTLIGEPDLRIVVTPPTDTFAPPPPELKKLLDILADAETLARFWKLLGTPVVFSPSGAAWRLNVSDFGTLTPTNDPSVA